GDITVLIDPNGEGQTTLLKILSGIESPTTSDVSWKKGLEISYLEQSPHYEDNKTIYQCLKSVFTELNAISDKLRKLELKMSEPTEDIDIVISYYGELQYYFEERGGDEIDSQIRKVVHG
ncbi:TPA: ABC-F family ATP-binding cassette domain-containing protein, partial [Staphylococcus pseudintermedius]|nr:ABC-F family ATP-binding cassette domain-containing protein [Staphylococcus pseudintermedius]